MLEMEDHTKSFKIIATVTIFAVVIFFLFIPVAMLGSTIESYSDLAADLLDSVDGSDNFTPGKISNQTMLQKAQSSF